MLGNLSRAVLSGASALALAAATLSAQAAPPGSDIYLVPLRASAHGLAVGTPLNITHRPGYDNEPSFTSSDSALLYVSIRGDGQADVYRYDIASRSTSRITATPESEYSPTPMPGGERFSVVRVERDSAQRLWSFRMDGSAPELVFPDIAPVGYHVWIDSATIALYVLGTPNSLEIVDRMTGRRVVVAHDVGRSLQAVPGRRELAYVQHERDGSRSLRLIDLARSVGGLQVVVKLASLPPRSAYVAWLPDRTPITGQDGKLLVRANRRWRELADLGPSGVHGITRVVASADGKWLAVVAADR